jgi:hypothetical protein
MAILPPDFLDSNPWAFNRLRQSFADSALQEGAVQPTAWKVTQRAAGANMTVDIAPGSAWVQGDNIALQGLYHVVNDGVISGGATITASHATLPRIDQVVLRVRDSVAGDAANGADLVVLAGVATAGATLANRTGALALPNSCMRLADVLVPAASGTVVNGNIRDRRTWARGAFASRYGSGANNHATGSNSFVAIDSGSYGFGMECSGAPFTYTFDCQVVVSTGGLLLIVGILIDGNELARREVTPSSANYMTPCPVSVTLAPTPGYHYFEPALAVGGTGVGTIINAGSSGAWPRLTFAENLRANGATGTYSSGAVNA